MHVSMHSLSVLSCAMLALAATGILGDVAHAQGNPGVAISNEFDAKAAERARRKAGPLAVPELAERSADAPGGRLFRLKRVIL